MSRASTVEADPCGAVARAIASPELTRQAKTMKPIGKCAVTSGPCWLCGRPATTMSAERPGNYEHPACRKETADEAKAAENAVAPVRAPGAR